MTTAIRITNIGGNRAIRVTEHGAQAQVEGHSAIVGELHQKGDELVVYVHDNNRFEIEEISDPPANTDPRDPSPEAA